MSARSTDETPEERARRLERLRFLGDLTNRQRLAFAFYTLFHSQGRRLVYWRKQWWQWAGTHYRRLDGDTLESVLSRFIKAEFAKAGTHPPNLTRAIIGDVLRLLQHTCTADAEREAPFSLITDEVTSRRHISLANGVLDVDRVVTDEQALFPHDPEWFSLAALPFNYDASAVCPRWDRFLFETFEGDAERISFIEEWMGYCCVYDYSHQHAVILTGEGANGKGVLTKVLVGLIGPENVSHVPLELFGQRFQLGPAVGKLLNTAPEISSIDKQAEEQLKAITGADRVMVDVKYGAHQQVAITARLMFSTNELPFFEDASGGLKRRLVIIPFNRVVPEAERNAKLSDELMTELPGIFNRALAGLRRLKARGRFEIPSLSLASLERHMLESAPAKTFLAEFTERDPAVAIGTMDLYDAYREWYRAQGLPPTRLLSQPVFAKEVYRVYRLVGAQMGLNGAGRLRYYVGLRGKGLDSAITMISV